MKGFFDLLIGDEVHEYKGRGSAQGIAAGVLADVCGKSLSLSGTLMGGYFDHALPPALPVQPGAQDGLRALRRAPLDTAVRLRGGHRRQARRRLGGGREVQQAAQVPQGGQGAAGTGSLRPLPHYREHRLPAPRGRGLRAAPLQRAGDALLNGLGDGLAGLLPAHGLHHRVRGAAQGRWRTPSRAAPSGCWRPTCKPCSPTPTAAPGGRRSSTPTRASRSSRCRRWLRTASTRKRRRSWTWSRRSGWRAAGCWSTPPTPAPGTSPSGWTTCSPGTGSGWR